MIKQSHPQQECHISEHALTIGKSGNNAIPRQTRLQKIDRLWECLVPPVGRETAPALRTFRVRAPNRPAPPIIQTVLDDTPVRPARDLLNNCEMRALPKNGPTSLFFQPSSHNARAAGRSLWKANFRSFEMPRALDPPGLDAGVSSSNLFTGSLSFRRGRCRPEPCHHAPVSVLAAANFS